MNTTTTTATGTDDLDNINNMNDLNNLDNLDDVSVSDNPGAQLAVLREQCGYSAEYVASKLHLRVCMIERLEADDYQDMPEPVFIKGYLRAYANLVGVKSEPFLTSFNRFHASHKRGGQERALWQTRRQTHQVEHITRWVTGAFAVIVVAAVAWWWSKSKDVETLFSAHTHQVNASVAHADSDIRLTDLSNMRTLLSPAQSKPSLVLGSSHE
ncbi:MAG: helix-turn-helix transcriptional regulator [Legionellaceae bacterium]|nr:helix-turn-helix transcriptional regulator [Legionellaceae bacterium]